MLRPSTSYTLTATAVVVGTLIAPTSTVITFRTGEAFATAPSLEGVLRRAVDDDQADLMVIEVELDTPNGTPPFGLMANWGPDVASVRSYPLGGSAVEVLVGGSAASATFFVGPTSGWDADEVCVQLRSAHNDFSQVPCQSQVEACVGVEDETIVCLTQSIRAFMKSSGS